mmetsp:Transcript_15853/g.34979  ORF Transcript_15853/g.34979 Transcript_15853/m.34979 type:complete len:209 (+) Transcript_15853:1439-2065(+)
MRQPQVRGVPAWPTFSGRFPTSSNTSANFPTSPGQKCYGDGQWPPSQDALRCLDAGERSLSLLEAPWGTCPDQDIPHGTSAAIAGTSPTSWWPPKRPGAGRGGTTRPAPRSPRRGGGGTSASPHSFAAFVSLPQSEPRPWRAPHRSAGCRWIQDQALLPPKESGSFEWKEVSPGSRMLKQTVRIPGQELPPNNDGHDLHANLWSSWHP